MSKQFSVSQRLLASGAVLLIGIGGGFGLNAVVAGGTTTPVTYYGCVIASSGTISDVTTTGTAPTCPPNSKLISWNSQGPSGTNGTNGSSVVTSSGVPSGSCTTGNTDIDLANGEVYTCTASAWVDTGNSIKGPPGATGSQGPPGASDVKDVTWTTELSGGGGDVRTNTTTQFSSGDTIQYLSATATGNLTQCPNWSIFTFTNHGGSDLVDWVGNGGTLNDAAPSNIENGSAVADGSGGLEAEVQCSNMEASISVTVTITIEWGHIPMGTIS